MWPPIWPLLDSPLNFLEWKYFLTLCKYSKIVFLRYAYELTVIDSGPHNSMVILRVHGRLHTKTVERITLLLTQGERGWRSFDSHGQWSSKPHGDTENPWYASHQNCQGTQKCIVARFRFFWFRIDQGHSQTFQNEGVQRRLRVGWLGLKIETFHRPPLQLYKVSFHGGRVETLKRGSKHPLVNNLTKTISKTCRTQCFTITLA